MSEQYESVVDNDTSALDAEPSLILDEDRLGTDPLEGGMDTAEGYSRDLRFQDGDEHDTLDERIPQEEPEVVAEEPPGRPLAATPAMDLDESVDDPENAVDGVGGLGTDGVPVDPVEAQLEGEIQVGLSSAEGAAEQTGLAADSGIGEVAGVEDGWPTEGAEQQAMHVEQD